MKPRFFPVFMDLSKKKILFVGAGRIATRRVKVLNDFHTDITVVAGKFSEELEAMKESGDVTFREESLHADVDSLNLLNDYDIVFACTDDYDLNHEIYVYCKLNGILINNCSNHNECDFYFPGIVKKENVVVGVNAGGNAHSQAKEIRKRIQDIL